MTLSALLIILSKVIIPESIALANERGLDEAILLLLGLEKKCRVNNDFSNLKEVCLHMIRLCRSKADWPKLNSTLAVINKRFVNFPFYGNHQSSECESDGELLEKYITLLT